MEDAMAVRGLALCCVLAELTRRVRAAFDPLFLFNPGRL